MPHPITCLLAIVFCTSGCSRWASTPDLPVASSVVLEQLVVYSDFKLPEQHRLLQDLGALRLDLTTQLDVPVSDEQVHVYLFKTTKRYKRFLRQHYPDFPDRRAFFVETDTRLSVYTFWGDRIAEDLRHEVAHGYLHAVIRDLPLWLDEGLAEYFEVDIGDRGLNRGHIQQLIAAQDEDQWRPDLEQLQQLVEFGEMQQIHYAEAWLWVHFMLRTTPQRKQMLQDHLAGLRNRSTVRLSDVIHRLEPDADRLLMEHLDGLRKDRQALLPRDS